MNEHGHLSNTTRAGLLIAVRPYLTEAGLPVPRIADVLATTGTSKSRAYAEKARISHVLGAGRWPTKADGIDLSTLSRRMVRFLMDHPGVVSGSSRRRSYSAAFRKFVLMLREDYKRAPLVDFARAVEVPLPTLREWLRGPHATDTVTRTRPDSDAEVFVGNAPDARERQRRRKRSDYEQALRNSFVTFFPGAQWVGDGTRVVVHVNGERFEFNLQLTVDTHSGALVGISVRKHEDCQAVLDSFDDGVRTTGAPPLALLLDNRPCNRADRLVRTLDKTKVLYATKGRPQNKAHVEGAFGLFTRQVPPMRLEASEPRELARQMLELMVTTWARTLNHRPRRDRGGQSRVELYRAGQPAAAERPTAEREAREHFARRCKRSQRSNEQPSQCVLVTEILGRLGLSDAGSRLTWALARQPVDALLAGVAMYESKQMAGTLPVFADREAKVRYLLRIICNIAEEDEGARMASALLLRRRELHGKVMRTLEEHRAVLMRNLSPVVLISALADEVLGASTQVARRFWLDALATAIRGAAAGRTEREHEFYEHATLRLLLDPDVPYRARLAAVRNLAAVLIPLT